MVVHYYGWVYMDGSLMVFLATYFCFFDLTV